MLPPVTVSSSSLESSRISESMSVSCLSLRKGGFPLARDDLLQAFHSSSVMQITERGSVVGIDFRRHRFRGRRRYVMRGTKDPERRGHSQILRPGFSEPIRHRPIHLRLTRSREVKVDAVQKAMPSRCRCDGEGSGAA